MVPGIRKYNRQHRHSILPQNELTETDFVRTMTILDMRRFRTLTRPGVRIVPRGLDTYS